MSALTGESVPVRRSAELIDTGVPLIQARDLLPFPLIVWGADELRRWLLRRRGGAAGSR